MAGTIKNGLKINWKRWLLWCLAVYLAGGLLLFFFQDVLLFHGVAFAPRYKPAFREPFEEINIKRADGNLHLVRFPLAQKKGAVLFFHGNMKNIEHYKQYPAFFLRNGYEVWMIDYPGFGKTTGKRTEQMLYNDALLFYNQVAGRYGSDSLVVYGKSIGTGIAAYLASVRPCRQLILETPYYSADALAAHYFPVYPASYLLHYHLPTHHYLANTKAAVTLLHGTRDELIPFQQAQRLKSENPSVQLYSIPNGRHNNLWTFAAFQKTIDSLL